MFKEYLIERELKTINGELSSHVEMVSQKKDNFSLLYQKYSENFEQYQKRMDILMKYQQKLQILKKDTDETIKYQTKQLIELNQKVDSKIQICEKKLAKLDESLLNLKQRKRTVKFESKSLAEKLNLSLKETENLNNSTYSLTISQDQFELTEKETENKLSVNQKSINECKQGTNSIVKKIAKIKRTVPYLEQQVESLRQKIESENDKIAMLQKSIQDYGEQNDNLRRSYHNLLTLSVSQEEFQLSLDEHMELSKSQSMLKTNMPVISNSIINKNKEMDELYNKKMELFKVCEKKGKELTEMRNSIEALKASVESLSGNADEYRKKCLRQCLQGKIELSNIANEKLVLNADLKTETEQLQKLKALLSKNLELYPSYLDTIDLLYKAQNDENELIEKYGQLKLKLNLDEAIVINNETFEPDTSYQQIEKEAKYTSEQVKELRKQVKRLNQENFDKLKQIRIFNPNKAKEFDIQRIKYKLEELEQNCEQQRIDIDLHKTNIHRSIKQAVAKIFIVGYNMIKNEIEQINSTNTVSETSLAQWKEFIGIVDFLPEEYFNLP